jgi:hypothetical protein
MRTTPQLGQLGDDTDSGTSAMDIFGFICLGLIAYAMFMARNAKD